MSDYLNPFHSAPMVGQIAYISESLMCTVNRFDIIWIDGCFINIPITFTRIYRHHAFHERSFKMQLKIYELN